MRSSELVSQLHVAQSYLFKYIYIKAENCQNLHTIYVSPLMITLYSCIDYHPRVWVGNVFGHVCLSVCLCVCVSVCLSVFLFVQAITFKPLDIETSLLVCRYILTISRSSLTIKAIGLRSRLYEKK